MGPPQIYDLWGRGEGFASWMFSTFRKRKLKNTFDGRVAELVDALVLGTSVNDVRVRVSPRPPQKTSQIEVFFDLKKISIPHQTSNRNRYQKK